MEKEISPKVLLGIGAAAVVLVIGLLIYFLRASDPASQAPIAYKKFDYGAHMQQTHQMDRQAPVASSASPGGSPTATP